MFWTSEILLRERQRELLEAAERARLVAEARQARGGTHLLVTLRSAVAHLWAAARLRRRLA